MNTIKELEDKLEEQKTLRAEALKLIEGYGDFVQNITVIFHTEDDQSDAFWMKAVNQAEALKMLDAVIRGVKSWHLVPLETLASWAWQEDKK